MPSATPTFRLFVSSTFEDLVAERNALQRDVFPRLADACRSRGARFQAIDLRWGVREEAGLDHRTMDLCLTEIRRCKRTLLKPYFIVLLGDRYGWRPLPTAIDAGEFDRLLGHVDDPGDRDLLARWYRLDENAVPPHRLLAPRGDGYREWSEWDPVESRLRRILDTAARATGASTDALIKYEASATHQEILEGLGHDGEDAGDVFAFFRESAAPADDRLAEVRRMLDVRLPPANVQRYHTGDIEQLCAAVLDRLSPIIEANLSSLASRSERDAHTAFARDRASGFVGRTAVLDAIAAYVAGEGARPLVVHGPSGSGKSAIMAVASEGASVVRRFVGATPEASSGIRLLQSLCHEIAARCGVDGKRVVTFDEAAALFGQRLALATRERPLVVFIDALDQLAAGDPAATLAWLPSDLPPYCRVVVSSTDVLPALAAAPRIDVKPLTLEETALALDGWFAGARRRLQPAQQEMLFAACAQAGTPLYMKLAFEEARLWRSFDRLEQCRLGDGIDGIVDQLLERLSDPRNHGAVLVAHALGYLTAARYGLTEDELLALLAGDEDVWVSVVGEGTTRRHDPPLRRLPVVVWSRLYLDLEPYLTERAVPGGTTIAFFHRQLAERVRPGRAHHEALSAYFAAQPNWTGPQQPNLRRLTELVRQQVQAARLDQAEASLTDLDFVSAKCGAALVFELQEDYQALLAAVPERAGAQAADERRHERARAWAAVLERCARTGRPPAPEEIPASVDLSSHEGDKASQLLDETEGLHAFASFVERESHALAEYGGLDGFVPQHAFNWTPAGRLHDAAAWAVDRAATPLLLRRHGASHTRDSASPLRRTIEARDWIESVAMSAGAQRAVAGGQSGLVSVWSLNTGACVAELRGHVKPVTAVTVTPDGRFALSASYDGTLKLWNLETGVCARTLAMPEATSFSVSISADGTRAVVAAGSGLGEAALHVWDLRAGHLLRVWQPGTKWISGIALAPDCRCIVSSHTAEGVLNLWDFETGVCIRTMRGHTSTVNALAADAGSQAFSGSADGTLRRWDLETGLCTAVLEDWHGGESMDVTADGRYVASAGSDKTLRVWDVARGIRVRELRGHHANVSSVAIALDGSALLSASQDETLRLWDLTSPDSRVSVETYAASLQALAVTPDASQFITGSGDATLKIWDLEAGSVVLTLEGHASAVRALAVTANGRVVVSGSTDRTLRTWDVRSGACLATLEGHLSGATCVGITPDGRYAVSGSEAATSGKWGCEELKVWDLERGASLLTLPHPGSVTALAIAPDGRHVITASGADHVLRVWDLETATCVRKLSGNTSCGHNWTVTTVAIVNPRLVLSGSSGQRSPLIWDWRTGACLGGLSGHGGGINGLAVTSDGRWAASGSGDKTLRLWNLSDGHCEAVARLNLTCRAVAFAAPSNRLVAITDLEAVVFDVQGLSLVDSAAALARARQRRHE